jgi:hypothetical protein
MCHDEVNYYVKYNLICSMLTKRYNFTRNLISKKPHKRVETLEDKFLVIVEENQDNYA